MASFKKSFIVLILQSASLIDMAECAVMCISIIMGVNVVCHKYCIVTWHRNHFRDLFINCYTADKDNPSSDALLSDNLSNSQKTFVEGQQVHSWMARRGIYSARSCSVSKSHNEYTDIKCNARDLMRLYRRLGGEVSILPCYYIGIIRKYTRIY